MVPPCACAGRRGDGDLTLLLIIRQVHGAPSIVEPTNIVQLGSVVNDALGGGSLANVNVGHDTNVPVHAKVDCPILVRGYVILVYHQILEFFMDREKFLNLQVAC